MGSNTLSELVHLEIRHGVGVIRVANPPVNAISHPVRQGLVDAVARAQEDASISLLLLVCEGRTFMAGADIREFGRPWDPPGLPEVVDILEASAKAIVAVIHGTALGGGLEVALGCHYRIATPDATLGFPEVRLGLIPGAQGTQRLPRLTGVAKALEMAVGGAPVTAHDAHDMGLVDALLGNPWTGDVDALIDAGLAACQDLSLATGGSIRRISELPLRAPEAQALFASYRERLDALPGGAFAGLRVVSALEAAVAHGEAADGFAAGLVAESALFQECLASTESAALRHVFFGEREVGKIPDLDRATPVREVRHVGVVGGGTMGQGIALSLLEAGFVVTLVEREWAPLTQAFGRIEAHYQRAVAKARMDEATALACTERLTGERDLGALATCDLVIEAVYEDLDLKCDIFTQLDAICQPGAILATNTSTLDVNRIAGATSRPGDVLGLHFFSPANIMRLLEIVRGEATADDVLATALKLARRLGKIGVVAGVCDGFIGNRMFDPYLREMDALLLEGASVSQVDAAMEAFGMRLGPCKVSDLAGIDVGYRIHQQRAARAGAAGDLAGTSTAGFATERALYDAGRLGQKAGAGYYRYEPGSYQAIPDPDVDDLIRRQAETLGMKRREIADGEIVERCLRALVEEGRRLLDEGIALRAVDIDIVYVHGYGFPAWRGGPMFHAGQPSA
jgi:3-hydroxyacyl-CoA dehydrogenase